MFRGELLVSGSVITLVFSNSVIFSGIHWRCPWKFEMDGYWLGGSLIHGIIIY